MFGNYTLVCCIPMKKSKRMLYRLAEWNSNKYFTSSYFPLHRYGCVTNTKIKIIIIIDSTNSLLRDNEIRAVSLLAILTCNFLFHDSCLLRNSHSSLQIFYISVFIFQKSFIHLVWINYSIYGLNLELLAQLFVPKTDSLNIFLTETWFNLGLWFVLCYLRLWIYVLIYIVYSNAVIFWKLDVQKVA